MHLILLSSPDRVLLGLAQCVAPSSCFRKETHFYQMVTTYRIRGLSSPFIVLGFLFWDVLGFV